MVIYIQQGGTAASLGRHLGQGFLEGVRQAPEIARAKKQAEMADAYLKLREEEEKRKKEEFEYEKRKREGLERSMGVMGDFQLGEIQAQREAQGFERYGEDVQGAGMGGMSPFQEEHPDVRDARDMQRMRDKDRRIAIAAEQIEDPEARMIWLQGQKAMRDNEEAEIGMQRFVDDLGNITMSMARNPRLAAEQETLLNLGEAIKKLGEGNLPPTQLASALSMLQRQVEQVQDSAEESNKRQQDEDDFEAMAATVIGALAPTDPQRARVVDIYGRKTSGKMSARAGTLALSNIQVGNVEYPPGSGQWVSPEFAITQKRYDDDRAARAKYWADTIAARQAAISAKITGKGYDLADVGKMMGTLGDAAILNGWDMTDPEALEDAAIAALNRISSKIQPPPAAVGSASAGIDYAQPLGSAAGQMGVKSPGAKRPKTPPAPPPGGEAVPQFHALSEAAQAGDAARFYSLLAQINQMGKSGLMRITDQDKTWIKSLIEQYGLKAK